MNICKYASYRVKQGLGFSKRVCTFEQLTTKWNIQQIKQFLKTKAICINYCGKCEFCLSVKKQQYKKRVKSQLSKSKYNYLITLTFDNDNIDLLITDEQKQKLLNNNVSLSPISNLSKSTISNIIKNWKNKVNRYYNSKVDFHYFLCGEYGENTQRAHYHVLLMLDRPLPNLIKQPVRGNHWKSPIIDSSQYALYDIEPANSSTDTAGYISKYLSKSQDLEKGNYNRLHCEQIKWMVGNGIEPFGWELVSKETDIKYIILWFILDSPQLFELLCKSFNWNKIKTKICKQQRPFVKCSRQLGMSDDKLVNFQNGVINRYYLEKYKFEKDVKDKKGIDTTELTRIIQLYDEKRKSNIQEYFYKSSPNEKNKNKTDIF